MDHYPGPLAIHKCCGDEPIMADNTMRGVLAEYLVATALGAEMRRTALRLRGPEGLRGHPGMSVAVGSFRV